MDTSRQLNPAPTVTSEIGIDSNPDVDINANPVDTSGQYYPDAYPDQIELEINKAADRSNTEVNDALAEVLPEKRGNLAKSIADSIKSYGQDISQASGDNQKALARDLQAEAAAHILMAQNRPDVTPQKAQDLAKQAISDMKSGKQVDPNVANALAAARKFMNVLFKPR